MIRILFVNKPIISSRSRKVNENFKKLLNKIIVDNVEIVDYVDTAFFIDINLIVNMSTFELLTLIVYSAHPAENLCKGVLSGGKYAAFIYFVVADRIKKLTKVKEAELNYFCTCASTCVRALSRPFRDRDVYIFFLTRLVNDVTILRCTLLTDFCLSLIILDQVFTYFAAGFIRLLALRN